MWLDTAIQSGYPKDIRQGGGGGANKDNLLGSPFPPPRSNPKKAKRAPVPTYLPEVVYLYESVILSGRWPVPLVLGSSPRRRLKSTEAQLWAAAWGRRRRLRLLSVVAPCCSLCVREWFCSATSVCVCPCDLLIF